MRSFWLGIASVLLVAFVATFAWIWLRWDAPPLHINPQAASVRVNVATLGEYPTTITHIRLTSTDESRVVWDIRALEGDSTQAHDFTLKVGDNDKLPKQFPRYVATVPADSSTFRLSPQGNYRIEVWRGKDSFRNRSAVEFHMPPH